MQRSAVFIGASYIQSPGAATVPGKDHISYIHSGGQIDVEQRGRQGVACASRPAAAYNGFVSVFTAHVYYHVGRSDGYRAKYGILCLLNQYDRIAVCISGQVERESAVCANSDFTE